MADGMLGYARIDVAYSNAGGGRANPTYGQKTGYPVANRRPFSSTAMTCLRSLPRLRIRPVAVTTL